MMMTVNTTNNGEFSEDGKPGSRADGLPKAAEDPMEQLPQGEQYENTYVISIQ